MPKARTNWPPATGKLHLAQTCVDGDGGALDEVEGKVDWVTVVDEDDAVVAVGAVGREGAITGDAEDEEGLELVRTAP